MKVGRVTFRPYPAVIQYELLRNPQLAQAMAAALRAADGDMDVQIEQQKTRTAAVGTFPMKDEVANGRGSRAIGNTRL